MKKLYLFLFVLLIASLVLVACGSDKAEPTSAPEPEPTEAPAPEPTEPPAAEPEATEASAEPPATAGLSCDKPIKIGFITDLTGPLAIYGTMAERGFRLGMEYAAGAPGVDGVYNIEGCEVQVLVRDDAGSAETTATLARELIDVEDVDILVGTVSSGSTASLQEIAKENDVVLIVAPAAAND
ncbi:MAG TPA: ABC transporter substrate-binding protein, partial [Caldilineae bacterium]|nr:ABC transporter substrate-binding protein [Caldilineae bacterium]